LWVLVSIPFQCLSATGTAEVILIPIDAFGQISSNARVEHFVPERASDPDLASPFKGDLASRFQGMRAPAIPQGRYNVIVNVDGHERLSPVLVDRPVVVVFVEPSPWIIESTRHVSYNFKVECAKSCAGMWLRVVPLFRHVDGLVAVIDQRSRAVMYDLDAGRYFAIVFTSEGVAGTAEFQSDDPVEEIVLKVTPWTKSPGKGPN